MAGKKHINALYYITHIDNIESIIRYGILSHEEVENNKDIKYTPIYDENIIGRRRLKEISPNVTLLKYANLYFKPRNAMLYRVVCEKTPDKIAIIALNPTILENEQAMITDGNAANDIKKIMPISQGSSIIDEIEKLFKKQYWNDFDDSKRKMMAELLVPNKVDSKYINTIYVANEEVAQILIGKLRSLSRNSIIIEPDMFFQPRKVFPLTMNLNLVQGDMFFSELQTLTVSVNIRGVMGKGLASRAKYQFPDVYVKYQDACRKKQLRMGVPFLYRREKSIEAELADEPRALNGSNNNKWFLLFATKDDWRQPANLKAIEEGLNWILNNYEKEGIKSLAVPALGCGLGRLQWKQVGPIICRILSQLDIQVSIYLPAEGSLEEKYLTSEFLLGN